MPHPCRATRLALRVATLVPLLVATPAVVRAQHDARGAGAPATAPAREAAQFDFLVGQWELEVRPKVNSLAARIHGAPKLLGSWKAWKVMDGFAVENELRIMDRSGNPSALFLSVRQWSPGERRWIVTGHDAYRARASSATATWDGTVMVVRGTGDAPQSLTRTRFSAITATSFHWEQDRSDDGGKTWNEKALVIDARRVSATAPR
ncbi:MAG TPA: hypothetical protein VFV33_15590 [Gemmatimonadaceae bacterium]|nr:hypothetical protein [Gemmatimonadaceae bacterium]